eukprot:g2088.t1 g2088   contig11:693954-695465(+)
MEVRADYSGMMSDASRKKDENIETLKKKLRISTDDDKERNAANTPTDKQQHTLLNVVCDITTSWKDPAAGPVLARICRILPTQNGEYRLEWENFVDSSMETSQEVVDELARWYCLHAMAHFLKSTSIISSKQLCHKRRLRDITSSNILSHVVVKVLRCEKSHLLSALAQNTNNYLGKYETTQTRNSESIIVTHATISDGSESDDIIGINSCVGQVGGASNFLSKAISSILLQSMAEGTYILLTHVLSQRTMGSGVLQGRESLFLVPTRETTATIVTSDHPYFKKQSPRHDGENPFASQPITLERSSQLFSLTQQHSPSNKGGDSVQSSRGLMAVVSPLVDIIIDGVDTSLVEGKYWDSPMALSKFLIEQPNVVTGMPAFSSLPSYRTATIILDPNVFSRGMILNADGDALKLLCMDVPAEDMLVEECSKSVSVSHPYLPHVGAMLKALCEEKALIRWILEQESECNWFVSSAMIVEA